MSKAAFYTLGCKVNQYETEAMSELFSKAGYEICNFDSYADVYVINTCTVTAMSDRKSRQIIRRAKKHNPNSVVIVTGCYAQTNPEAVAKISGVNLILGTNDRKKIVELCQSIKPTEQLCNVGDIMKLHDFEDMAITDYHERTRAYIKIQEGCNQFCSYCIIPYARGPIRSRDIDDVISETEILVKNGYTEVIYTGIHVASYGLDKGGAKLSELLCRADKIEGLKRIRLSSIEPMTLNSDFIKSIEPCKKLCHHFHLSLQSGCDETLKRMNRHYTTGLYLEKCGILRQYFDRPALTTDVIVGFPGETEEEFAQTERFLETVHFSDMHIFKYSKRRGTKAADMPNQIDPQIQSVRSEKLIALGERMKDDFLEACKDQEQIVLIEEETEIDGTKYMTGHSKNYIRCAFEMDGLVPNMVIKGTINSKLNEEFVFCKRID